jgi:hypothetical protein
LRIFAIFHDDIIGWQWCPADVIIASPPIDPSWSPLLARNPNPTKVAIPNPTAVMIGHPAEIALISLRNPIPAPFIRINPMALGVRAPIPRAMLRDPDFAVTTMRYPVPIRLKGASELY